MKKSIIIILLAICTINVKSQVYLTNDIKVDLGFKKDSSVFAISFSPQHIAISGFKLCFEKKISEKASVVLTPELYVKKNANDEETIGAGLLAYHRIYLTDKHSSYFSYGGGYNFFNIKFTDYAWIQDGDTWYSESTDINYKISRYRLDFLIGSKLSGSERILIDIYIGAGLQYSVHDKDNSTTEKYNNSIIDYGYTGTMLLIGARFGINFYEKQ